MHLFLSGKRVQADEASAGDFCKIWGLSDVKIGDVVGQWCEKIRHLHFVEPQMESRIEAQNAEQSHQLYPALTELAEEDPLIKVSKESFHHELYLRIFGEVQKEVLEAMLLERYGLAVRFSETRVVCIEKPVGTGTGQGLDVMGSARNPFAATIGLRVQPGQPGSGITYSYAVQLGSLPAPLHRAIEETVYETLKQGLYGWEVQDLAVTLTHSGYSSVGSTAGDFRNLTPLVLMEAFQQAGSEVYEPINDFELSAPIDLVSPAMYQLTLAKALFGLPILRPHSFELTGTLPVTTTEAFKRELYSLARGEGIFLTRPAGYRKVEPPYPTRQRTDANPLDRNEYLFHVIGPRAKLYQLA